MKNEKETKRIPFVSSEGPRHVIVASDEGVTGSEMLCTRVLEEVQYGNTNRYVVK